MLICTRCLIEEETMPSCKTCNIPYCSKGCQTRDWKRHKQECNSKPTHILSRTRAQLQIWLDHKERIGSLTLIGNLLLLPQDAYKSCYLDVNVKHDGKLGFYIPKIIPLPASEDALGDAGNSKGKTVAEKKKESRPKNTNTSNNMQPVLSANGVHPLLTSTQIEKYGEKPPQKAIFGVRIQHLLHMSESQPDFFKCVRQHLNETETAVPPKVKKEIFILMHCDLGGDLPSQIMMTTIKVYPVNSHHAEAMDYYSTYPHRLIEKFNRNEDMLDLSHRRGGKLPPNRRVGDGASRDPFFRDFQYFLERLANPTRHQISTYT